MNLETLSLLKCKNENVSVIILSDNKGTGAGKLRQQEILSFNDEYPTLAVKKNHGISHDRYIVIDYGTENEKVYHCGASSKDAGRKVCGINQVENTKFLHGLIDQLLGEFS